MKKSIQLRSIRMINFKGIRDLKIEVKDVTDIFGDNGTGKTTIFDAFTWLLFGKDSSDRKDFEVKTLDAHNKAIPKIDHEVTAVIEVNGEEITLTRCLKESWVKKRGGLHAEFAGNETQYYWNEVPMQAKQYADKIAELLDEKIFKLITNPMAFNALNWKDGREVLMQIAGNMTDAEFAAGHPEFEALISSLNGRSFADHRAVVAAQKKKMNANLKEIPVRIAEVSNGKPEPIDFEGIRAEIAMKSSELETVESQLADKSKHLESFHEEQGKVRTAIYNKKNEIAGVEFEAKSQAISQTKVDTSNLDRLTRELRDKNSDLEIAQRTETNLKSQVATLESDCVQLRNDWAAENAKELKFSDDQFCCPTCKRDFEAGDVEAKKADMMANFKTAKAIRLASINEQGKSKADSIAVLNGRIQNGQTLIASLKADIQALTDKIEIENGRLQNVGEQPSIETIVEAILGSNADYQQMKSDLALLEAQIKETPAIDDADLSSRKAGLKSEIDALKSQLSIEETIKRADARIAELEKEEQTLAQQIADIENTEFVINNFNRHKIDTLEGKINSKFQYVRFKLFDTQINGGEVECCEALISGVPFSNSNTASKINAGIDIINTLCDFFQVTAPIFIDNRESVIKLIASESQIINLIVSEKDKTLSVVSYELDKAVA